MNGSIELLHQPVESASRSGLSNAIVREKFSRETLRGATVPE
ncbi:MULTISPECIES: hypothetical protein [unclassified Paraburkholderia]|nr:MULTISPECIES: hypothetical protein [unclassified Paraburkholderia]MBB5448054.1 hypothetical protein [Paraburkholderia sp. WSM4177]MBB5488469.1 hypothetical protein [Paraburkholderia sp. WSM4180]